MSWTLPKIFNDEDCPGIVLSSSFSSNNLPPHPHFLLIILPPIEVLPSFKYVLKNNHPNQSNS